MVDGQGEVVAVHCPDVTLEGVVAGKASGGGVAARAGVGQRACVGPGEPRQGDIINHRIRDIRIWIFPFRIPDMDFSIPDPRIPGEKGIGSRIRIHNKELKHF